MEDINLYFVPEMCTLAGLDDTFIRDRDFMIQLAEYTKLTPKWRIEQTRKFLDLLKEGKRKEGKDEKSLSAKERSESYGIEVTEVKQFPKAYHFKEAVLKDGKKETIDFKENPLFHVASKKVDDETDWICLYRKGNYDEASNFYDYLKDACEGYNLAITEPKWVEM